ncbi:atrial natriuretic peptide receptor 1-like [Amphibalanus amphitrite]|uniref:atrial natriuretic peptide receptor 1-like n=1 Tax=Amphibalanus amphitrite TaxID=1232801 RepID=UPI001C915E8F|nr:atrial natriuretic peptide receptor 1-like [Amphibalanus amphitrite]
MRDLRHDNLNPFIGACVDPPHLCTVSDYCTRGSLRDILENANVKLDNMFIASMVFDIIRGMMFLHDSPLRFHGNLKTTNCLVDSRWVVKVADFGLAEIINRSDQHLETEKDVRQKCEDLLFKAPEQLRCSGAEAGSQKADVYSFAMVLYEIHSRSPPFSGMGLGPLELLQSVIKRSSNNNPVFRPPIHMLDTCFDCVRVVLAECWAEDPDSRPDFKAVRNKLRPMRKGMKPHIFDNMLTMMEKYTNNLEVLVDERTNLLIVEKKKTEALLHEMLPRYVADQLKRGKSVQAESFDSVTIYFSDIVGFTAMSAESTPLQVVDFLNDLYTCFDSIIDNYDVYKVETIGDAYMVVSGLPVRNGLQHAGEVASMSLHLLEAIRSFTIRHRPQDTLMLRIGIHTGPVCAGVVGRKMPRYCLYGDTVNTASRMESTGSPLRIHCSASCRSVLMRLGGYNLEERGPTYLKGKGDVVTYWLVGEDEKRQARRRQNITKMKQQQQLRGALRSRSPGMERTYSLESPRRLRFASDRRRELGQLKKSNLASDCLCDAQRRSCPCIHELDDESASPAGDLDMGRSADWLTVTVTDHATRSDSALHSVHPRPRFELDTGGSDITESEPLLASAPGNSETRI